MSQLHAVIGANYGDEGKGYMTDLLCARALENGRSCIVVCSNGGAQRGHTVETDDGKRFVFHHLGSGSLLNTGTWFCPDFILNPMLFRLDWEAFIGLNPAADRLPRLSADPACRFTTPYDMMINRIFEDLRGDRRHGSVGAGIWETVRRYEKGFGIPLSVMLELSLDEQKQHLKAVRAYAEDRIFKKAGIKPSELDAWKNIWSSETLIDHYLDDFSFMTSLIELKTVHALSVYDIIVVENAQGILLTQDRYNGSNHTTPSDTGAKQISRLLSQGLKDFCDEVTLHYVTRSYLTKHGAGDFPGECSKERLCPEMHDLTNIPNDYQGSIRYGMLDPELLFENILFDLKDMDPAFRYSVGLSVTHLNEYCSLSDLERIRSLSAENGFALLLSDGRTRTAVTVG